MLLKNFDFRGEKMEKQIPLSWKAESALDWEREMAIVKRMVAIILLLIPMLMGVMYILDRVTEPWNVSHTILTVFMTTSAGYLLYHASTRLKEKRERIFGNNAVDFESSQRLQAYAEKCQLEPKKLLEGEMNCPSFVKLEGLIVERIEFLPQEKLEGLVSIYIPPLAGITGGWAYGAMEGEITPLLSRQNVMIFALDGKKNAFRLLCPLPEIAFQYLQREICRVWRKRYGTDSLLDLNHRREALREFIYGKKGLRNLFSALGAGEIFNLLATQERLPQEERSKIWTVGIPRGENFEVAAIGCEKFLPKVITPYRFMGEIISHFEMQLLGATTHKLLAT